MIINSLTFYDFALYLICLRKMESENLQKSKRKMKTRGFKCILLGTGSTNSISRHIATLVFFFMTTTSTLSHVENIE